MCRRRSRSLIQARRNAQLSKFICAAWGPNAAETRRVAWARIGKRGGGVSDLGVGALVGPQKRLASRWRLRGHGTCSSRGKGCSQALGVGPCLPCPIRLLHCLERRPRRREPYRCLARRDGGRPRSRSRSRSKERRRRADDRGGRSPSARDRRREDGSAITAPIRAMGAGAPRRSRAALGIVSDYGVRDRQVLVNVDRAGWSRGRQEASG